MRAAKWSQPSRNNDNVEESMREHSCVNGEQSTAPSWWTHDAQGIPLARVCARCKREKLARYRPEILTGYDNLDVDEPIEADTP